MILMKYFIGMLSQMISLTGNSFPTLIMKKELPRVKIVARTRTFPPYLHLIEPIRPMGSATTLIWPRFEPPVQPGNATIYILGTYADNNNYGTEGEMRH